MSAWFRAPAAPSAPLSTALEEGVSQWRALAQTPSATRLSTARFAVVDIETTGLDTRRDQVLALGAVMVERGAIAISDSFYRVVKQAAPSSSDNILIHRIGGEAQVAGVDAALALTEFLRFVGKTPLVAFHAPFDAAMLSRACESHLRFKFAEPWLDLATLAPALMQDLRVAHGRDAGLDRWLAALGLRVARRHHALSDALATAQLLQAVLARCPRENVHDLAALRKLAGGQRWLGH